MTLPIVTGIRLMRTAGRVSGEYLVRGSMSAEGFGVLRNLTRQQRVDVVIGTVRAAVHVLNYLGWCG